MANINNSDLTKELIAGAKIQLNVDKIPSQLAEKVVPVMEINPKLLRETKVLAFGGKTTTGDANIKTTSSTSKTYITGIHFSMVKDATCNKAIGTSDIIANINGVSTSLVQLPCLDTTAQELSTFVHFPQPILLDKATNILIGGTTYTVGLMSRSCEVYGYEVED